MEDRIIPFGKYKGKPVEVLASDKSYTEWLLAQDFFQKNHINLYNVVINNFREPVDTPEHNKIQIKFLNAKYRLQLAYQVNSDLFKNNSSLLNAEMKKIVAIDKGHTGNQGVNFLKALANPNAEEEFGLYTKKLLYWSKPVFEHVDVSYSIWYGLEFSYDSAWYGQGRHWFKQRRQSQYWIEIKPIIGDDFPSVLRQMKAAMPVKESDWQSDQFFILLVGKYTGTGASQEDFVEYFKSQGYLVVFEDLIEQVELPAFEREFKFDEEMELHLSKQLPA